MAKKINTANLAGVSEVSSDSSDDTLVVQEKAPKAAKPRKAKKVAPPVTDEEPKAPKAKRTRKAKKETVEVLPELPEVPEVSEAQVPEVEATVEQVQEVQEVQEVQPEIQTEAPQAIDWESTLVESLEEDSVPAVQQYTDRYAELSVHERVQAWLMQYNKGSAERERAYIAAHPFVPSKKVQVKPELPESVLIDKKCRRIGVGDITELLNVLRYGKEAGLRASRHGEVSEQDVAVGLAKGVKVALELSLEGKYEESMKKAFDCLYVTNQNPRIANLTVDCGDGTQRKVSHVISWYGNNRKNVLASINEAKAKEAAAKAKVEADMKAEAEAKAAKRAEVQAKVEAILTSADEEFAAAQVQMENVQTQTKAEQLASLGERAA